MHREAGVAPEYANLLATFDWCKELFVFLTYFSHAVLDQLTIPMPQQWAYASNKQAQGAGSNAQRGRGCPRVCKSCNVEVVSDPCQAKGESSGQAQPSEGSDSVYTKGPAKWPYGPSKTLRPFLELSYNLPERSVTPASRLWAFEL